MKKILDINEIYDFETQKIIIGDLTDYDLSGLDLSFIPSKAWDHCVIKNTNFSNTGANLDFSLFFTISGEVEDCNFEGTNIINMQMHTPRLKYYFNCDFRKTNIKFDKNYNLYSLYDEGFRFYDCYLPDDFFETYDSRIQCLNWCDVATIKKNPNLAFPEKLIFEAVSYELDKLDGDFVDGVKDAEAFIRQYDKSGKLVSFIETISKCCDGREDRIASLLQDRSLWNWAFKDVHFDSDLIFDLPISFNRCLFENCTFDAPVSDLFKRVKFRSYSGERSNNIRNNRFEGVVFPQMKHSSWKDIERNRVSGSRITARTNLYLELGRSCNARCEFCRNESFGKCEYNLETVLEKLKLVEPYIDDLVIGGGEPTLLLKDLKKLVLYVNEIDLGRRLNRYVFSNGTAPMDVYDWLKDKDFSLNISRHAVSDEENARILNCRNRLIGNKAKNANAENLRYLVRFGATICATCFSGGLDTKEKLLEYIEFAEKLGAGRVLLSNLHLDSSSGDLVSFNDINIATNLFKDTMAYLESRGFSKSIPIYSTGGYSSTVLEHGNFKVVFKEYISKKDIELEWNRASKRTFDLSIDPNGRLFDNWHQQSDEVILTPKVKDLGRR